MSYQGDSCKVNSSSSPEGGLWYRKSSLKHNTRIGEPHVRIAYDCLQPLKPGSEIKKKKTLKTRKVIWASTYTEHWNRLLTSIMEYFKIFLTNTYHFQVRLVLIFAVIYLDVASVIL